MKNVIKYVLVGFLFIAVVGAAYMTGLYSRDENSYSSDSRETNASSATRESTGSRSETGYRDSSPVPNDAAASTQQMKTSAEKASADAEGDRVNVEDYETLDPHDNAGSFRPDPYLLQEKFPNNRAVPPATPEAFIEKQQEREQRNEQYGKIAANKASKEEIEAYYREQARLAKDSIEILLYLLTEHRDEMNETDLLKHEFLVERFQKRLDLIPKRKAEALERLENQ